MSVEFTLHGGKLSLRRWESLLQKWVDKHEIETFSDATFEGDEASATAYIFARGAIRGVLLTYEAKTVHVRLGALASRRDWQYCFSLMRAALRAGGGTFERETGETYSRVELNRANAHTEALKDFVASVQMLSAQALKADDYQACFPTGTFNVPLRKEHFDRFDPDKPTQLEKRLRNKVRDLAEAYHSSTFVLNGGVRIATWALIPTIVGECDAIGVDYKKTTIPLETLKGILAGRAEDLGGGLTFLPELDRQADRKLLKAIAKAGVDVEELAAKSGATPESVPELPTVSESAMEFDRMVAIHDGAKLVIQNMFAGQDPEAAAQTLVEQGEDPEFAQALVLVVARIMTSTVQDGREADEVLAELIGEGLPEGLVFTAFEGIGEAIKEQEQQKAPKKKVPRAKKITKKKGPQRNKRRRF